MRKPVAHTVHALSMSNMQHNTDTYARLD